jgi:hypothetical protein
MATFSTYAGLGDPGSAAWYEYYAYYAEPTIEQKVVERYFTVDNGQLTPKPVSADTGGAGNFTVDRNTSKPKNWWDKAVQGTQNFFKGVGHAIGGATQAVGQAIGAGLDWLNQTVVSPVVDFVKKNATALAVVGLTLTTIGLTVANVVQLGADPATDGLELADLGLLGEKISQMTEEESAAGEKVAETASGAEKTVITNADDLLKNKELLQSSPNEANFWSGLGRDGDIQAANFTTENGGTTLEQLLEKNNIEMPAYNPLNPLSVESWEKASELYAEQASGKVNAIIGENIRPDSIWKTYELPALEKKPNVTEITETNSVTGEVNVIYKR